MISQVMMDKIVSVPRTSIREEIGQCDDRELDGVEDGLRRRLELG